jgi:hypothetical protein
MTDRHLPSRVRPVCRQLTAAALIGVPLLMAAGCAGAGSADPSPAARSAKHAGGSADGPITVANGTIHLKVAGSRPGLPAEAITEWVRTAARATVAVCGRYPVDQVDVEVRLEGGGKIEHGVTYDGRLIKVRLGRQLRTDDLRDDWVMTHEMFHLAFPDTDDELNWMGEGLSTYLEPIARGRIGNMNEAEVWGGYVLGMPQGLPERGDRGLNRTPSWGRTYWGGALFWLSADVEIRRQTDNQRSLDDAVKAILAAGGNGTEHWSADKIVDVGDRATGTKVLRTLYDRHAERAVQTDLPALWASLGIKPNADGTVEFTDAAPLAKARQSMTAKPAGGNRH